MIKEKSYTIEWLEAKVKEYDANSYDLAEKMNYAFTLLEQLQLKGLDFIFKGGTSLVLMLEEFHRFSKDIDIVVTEKPANLTEIFDAVVADTPFLRWEVSERKNDEFQVPKEHYKFIYQQSRPSKYPEQPVMLDIIFVENSYPETHKVNISHPFLFTEEPYTQVTLPTFDSITGDKLTAFAPATIGIPMNKKKAVEIAKQLYDLNLLFEKIKSSEIVGLSFEQTAAMVIKYYKKNISVEEVYQDIIESSFVMAMMGKRNPELFNEIKSGVVGLSDYLSRKTNFGYNIALAASAKIAYMAACLMKKKELTKLDWKTASPEEFRDRKIEHTEFGILNKALKAGYPEAWYYWLHTVEILNTKEVVKEEVIVIPIAKHDNFISLTFIVNGKEVTIEKENINESLKVPVEKALVRTGNSGRPLSDWLVKLNNQDLDVARKIEDFHFPADAKIFISLKAGVGGNDDLQVAEPEVTRTKFDSEVEGFRLIADEWRKKGVICLKVEFPVVQFVFIAHHLIPPAIAFGVSIDFTNYDVEPPSIVFINPLTGMPVTMKEMSVNFVQHSIIPQVQI